VEVGVGMPFDNFDPSQFSKGTYAYTAEGDMIQARELTGGKQGTPSDVVYFCEQALERYFKHLLPQVDFSVDEKLHPIAVSLIPLAAASGFRFSSKEVNVMQRVSEICRSLYPVSEDEVVPRTATWKDAENAYTFALRVRVWFLEQLHCDTGLD